MKLVRRNSYSVLTKDNRVEILQDASRFYPRLMRIWRTSGTRSPGSLSATPIIDHVVADDHTADDRDENQSA
jgi:hypothetical protein